MKRILDFFGLARKSEVDELRRNLANATWFVEQSEQKRSEDAIVVAADCTMVTGVVLEGGRQILVSPHAKHVHISNVYVHENLNMEP